MKKGQIAVTYRIAGVFILFFLLLAIAYFGVLDLRIDFFESCGAGPPLSCSVSGVDEDGVTMDLSNTDSRIMSIKKITVSSDALGDCSWEASGGIYPELESGNPPIFFTLTSNSTGNYGSGTFIPKSAEGASGTRVNPDNNANWGAADNSSLAGCARSPYIISLPERDYYKFTVIYTWKNSKLNHSVSGSFNGSHSRRTPNDFLFLLLRVSPALTMLAVYEFVELE